MKKNEPSARTYSLTGIALLLLLALTVGGAYVNLGPLNTAVAMSISLAKGALILLFFMHMRYSRPILWLFVGAGFFWLGIMFVLAMSDYLYTSLDLFLEFIPGDDRRLTDLRLINVKRVRTDEVSCDRHGADRFSFDQ